MMNNLGLQKRSDGTYAYVAHNAMVTANGVFHGNYDSSYDLHITNRCGTPQAVSSLYDEILFEDLTNSRTLALFVAIAAAWWSIFHQHIKDLHFQIPAVLYIGKAESGKTTFARMTSLLTPIPGGENLEISPLSTQKEISEAVERCQNGQLILSDLRKENAGTYGKVTRLLDAAVRPVAEKTSTPGGIFITAEPSILKNNLEESLLQRMLHVPTDTLMSTEDNINWMTTGDHNGCVGNMLITVLPSLLKKLNTIGDDGEIQWHAEFSQAYRAFSNSHSRAGHLRARNMQFLLLRAHEEILDAAESVGYISHERRAAIWAKADAIADWFFQRQLILNNPLGIERIRLAMEEMSCEIRLVEPRQFCPDAENFLQFKSDCESCRNYRRSQNGTEYRCKAEQHKLSPADYVLRPDEFGISFAASKYFTLPKNYEEQRYLWIVRRDPFLTQLSDQLEKMGRTFHISSGEFKPLDLEKALRHYGLLAYSLRNGKLEHFNYSQKWSAIKLLNHTQIHSLTSSSVLIMQVPVDWNLSCFITQESLRFGDNVGDVVKDPNYIFKPLRFKVATDY